MDQQWIIVTAEVAADRGPGSLVTNIGIIGPFDSQQKALDYGMAQFEPDRKWQIEKLLDPDTY